MTNKKIPEDEADILSLEDIFSSVEKLTGLEISTYSSIQGAYSSTKLPIRYRRHMSSFCRTVKANRAGLGCGNHDSIKMKKYAEKVGRPFVNICHAGVAEVIIPVFGVKNTHITTIFMGQAVTEEVDVGGFRKILRCVKKLGVDEAQLKEAFDKLPRISRKDLLNFGRTLDMALKNFFKKKGAEEFEQELLIAGNPAIRRALDIIDKEGAFLDLTETELARKVFLDPSYFSRLFKKIMKRNFTNYLTEKKISLATSLLHNTHLPVMKIAQICGYSRQSYFTRVFRNATGMAPSQYRNDKTRKSSTA